MICATGEKELARAAVELRSVGATRGKETAAPEPLELPETSEMLELPETSEMLELPETSEMLVPLELLELPRLSKLSDVKDPPDPSDAQHPLNPRDPSHPPCRHAIAGDVADREFGRRLVDEALHRFGRVDVLVNNASLLGPSPLPPLRRYPLDQLEQVFSANVFGPLYLVQRVVPGMLGQRGRGLIVNISSDAAVGGYPGWGGYGASKAALDLITHTLANELEGTGVSAVAIDPGDMRTEMHQAAFPGEDISDRPHPREVVPAI